MGDPVMFKQAWYENSLQCPLCEGGNLHHTKVTVFNRVPDDGRVRVSVVGDLVVVKETDSLGSGNPSGRRDGLRISFWCETCDEGTKIPDLCIVQHKGTTYIYWDEEP